MSFDSNISKFMCEITPTYCGYLGYNLLPSHLIFSNRVIENLEHVHDDQN